MRFVRFALLVCLLGWGEGIRGDGLQAQPVFWSDEGLPARAWARPLQARSGTPDTLTVTAAEPFFDDFSSPGAFPDSNRWFVPATLFDVPQRTEGLAIDPPTQGVLTFDGNSRLGEPYQQGNLVSGVADRLFSHYLDLSGYNATSGLRLSFALQPQGRGEAPEANDSLVVLFRTPAAPPQDFVQVFSLRGGTAQGFRQYEIPLDDPAYFHAGFQLRFESHGSLNGALDLWHLDYVYLAPGRTAGDTLFADQAIGGMPGSPFAPYTALPIQQYEALPAPMSAFSVQASNLAAAPAARSLRAELSEPLNETPLVPVFAQEANPLLAATSVADVSFGAFSRQPLDAISALDLTTYLTGGDSYPANDTLVRRFRVDSLMGWDDGEPDAAFGFNQARSYGIAVDLPQPDSLTAVWIRFSPLVHYNVVSGQATYLKDKGFRLAVWDRPNPDSLLLQQSGGMTVRYGDAPGGFVRYPLSEPVPVTGTFWVGVQQTDAIPLGIGFDRNYEGDYLTVYDSLGQFVPLREPGILMIRPEFYNTRPVPAALDAPLSGLQPRLYPTPVTGGQLFLAWPAGARAGRYEAVLRDLQGRACARFAGTISPGSTEQLTLPPSLSPGLYLWDARASSGGHRFRHHQMVQLH